MAVMVTKVENKYVEDVQLIVLVRISKPDSGVKRRKGEKSKDVFEVQASADLLRLLSPYFAQLLSGNESGVLELSEDEPEAAAKLIVFMHANEPYPQTWDAIEAALCAKWILTPFVNTIKSTIDKFLAGCYNDVNGFASFGDDEKAMFCEVCEIVSTHIAYNEGNKLVAMKVAEMEPTNKILIAITISRDNPVFLKDREVIALNAKEMKVFMEHVNKEQKSLAIELETSEENNLSLSSKLETYGNRLEAFVRRFGKKF